MSDKKIIVAMTEDEYEQINEYIKREEKRRENARNHRVNSTDIVRKKKPTIVLQKIGVM